MAYVMAFSYDSRPIQTLLNQIRNIKAPLSIDSIAFFEFFIYSQAYHSRLYSYSVSKNNALYYTK